MADKKISALNAASTVGVGDYLVIVQGTDTLKCDVATFLAKAPAPLVSQAATETVASGALSKTVQVSRVSAPASANVNYTLAAPVGADKNAEKVIVATAVTNTYTVIVTVTGGVGVSTITFSDAGETVHLREVDGSWFVIGSHGVVIA